MGTSKKRTKGMRVDLEKSFYDTANKMNHGKYSAKKATKGKGILIALLSVCAAVLLCLILGFLYLGGFVGNAKLSQNTTIAGINVSGLNRKSAISAIHDAVDATFTLCPMEVIVGDQTVILTPETAMASLDVDKAVTMAFLKRHAGSSFDVSPYISVNEEAIRKALAPLGEHFKDNAFQESSYKVLGNKPALDEAHLNDPVQQVEIFTGVPSYAFSADELYAAVLKAYSENKTVAQYSVPTKAPTPVNLTAIHNELYVAPVNASMDPETFQVTPHQYGYGLDIKVAQEQLNATPYGQSVTISCVRITPEKTTESVGSVLYRDVLSTYKAVASSQGNRDINLKLSCQAINGIIVQPGEVFSYNQTLGERTPEKGYKPATSYMGADVIQTYGGGICQASSSLYYCAMMADLEIVERHNHGYLSTYVPYGMDATVDWSGPDFKFKNTTDYPIRIEAYAEGGTVVVTLLGTDTKEHYVKMEYEILSKEDYKVIYQEIPKEDNPKKYKDGEVINSPYTGYDIKTYRCRYDKETDTLLSRELEEHSRYAKRDKLVAKIIDPKPEPAPEPEPDMDGTGISPDE